MNLLDIQELIKFVAKSGATEVDLEFEGVKISIKSPPKKRRGEKEDVVNNFDYVIENNQLGIKMDTDKSFSVMINVSNICIQEFGESCPDEFY